MYLNVGVSACYYFEFSRLCPAVLSNRWITLWWLSSPIYKCNLFTVYILHLGAQGSSKVNKNVIKSKRRRQEHKAFHSCFYCNPGVKWIFTRDKIHIFEGFKMMMKNHLKLTIRRRRFLPRNYLTTLTGCKIVQITSSSCATVEN